MVSNDNKNKYVDREEGESTAPKKQRRNNDDDDDGDSSSTDDFSSEPEEGRSLQRMK
jgi:hypothetical protein